MDAADMAAKKISASLRRCACRSCFAWTFAYAGFYGSRAAKRRRRRRCACLGNGDKCAASYKPGRNDAYAYAKAVPFRASKLRSCFDKPARPGCHKACDAGAKPYAGAIAYGYARSYAGAIANAYAGNLAGTAVKPAAKHGSYAHGYAGSYACADSAGNANGYARSYAGSYAYGNAGAGDGGFAHGNAGYRAVKQNT